MGFSLQRALKGAIGAGVSLLDMSIKEEANQRERDAQMAKEKEMAVFREGLTEQRERRAVEMNDAKLEKKRAEYKSILGDGRNEMEEAGLKFNTPAGQFFLAERFMKAGHPDQANIFFDNGKQFQQTTDNADFKRIQLKASADARNIAAANRADGVTERAERRSAAEEEKYRRLAIGAGDKLVSFEEKDGELVKKKYDSGGLYANKAFQTGVDNGMTPSDAAKMVRDLVLQTNNRMKVEKTADPGALIERGIGKAGAALGWAGYSNENAGPGGPVADTTPPPSTQSSRPKETTPSGLSQIGSAISSRVGPNDGTPFSEWFGIPKPTPEMKSAWKKFNTAPEL